MPTSPPLSAPDFLSKWTARFADNTLEFIEEGTFREFAADIDASFAAVANVPSIQQSISLVAAKALLTAGTVQPLYYAIDFGADSAGHPQTVYVRGLGGAAFDTQGVLLVNGLVSQAVVNVAVGTFSTAGRPLNELLLPSTVQQGLWYVTPTGIWEARGRFSAATAPVAGANWRAVVTFAGGNPAYAQDLLSPSAEQAPSTAAVADALAALNGAVVLYRLDGRRTAFATFAAAHAAAEEGDALEFGPGAFGNAADTLVLTKSLDIRLHALTVWRFGIFYLHAGYAPNAVRTVRLHGPGQVRGTVFWYGDVPLDVELVSVRHTGALVHNAYGTGAGTQASRLLLDNVQGTAPAGTDYITAYTRNQGFYFKPLDLEVRAGAFVVPSGRFFVNTGSAGNPSDAAGNRVRLVKTHIECAPGTALFAVPDGVTTFDFAGFTSYTGTLPANAASARTYQYLPAAGSAPAPPANQAPAVTSLTLSASSVPAGTAVTATATASDADGTVASVEFFLDGVLKGTATNGPNFSLSITPNTVGAGRQVTAQATDNQGAKSAISAPQVLAVTGANTPPGQVVLQSAAAASQTTATIGYAPPASGGSPVTDYLVEYRPGANAFAAFAHPATTALSQTLTGLAASTAYDVRVSAVNAVGTGLASNVLSFTTPGAGPTYADAAYADPTYYV